MGFWNLLGFGKRKETNKESALEAINTDEIQNEMLRSTGFYRMYEDGGVIDELPNAYGEFGRDPTNPIPVNGTYGEVTYLSRLREKNTESIVLFHRLGSTKSNGVCEHPVDCFELVSLDGMLQDKLFLDMYHIGKSSKVPEGYTRVRRLEGLTGVPERVADFPLGIYDKVTNYSKRVFGAPIAMPEIQIIEGTSLRQGKTNKKQRHYFIERLQESKEYLQSWSIAGKYLQAMFDQYNQKFSDKHNGFCWLRTDIISPTFDSMNFRYKNRVFSVLLDLVIPVKEDAFLTKTTQRMMNLQVDICQKNDIIPCLFPIAIDKMKPLRNGWNLRNTETREMIVPMDIADDSPRPISQWELMNWGISIVMDDLRKNGKKILSFTDAPGIMPQLWFEDDDGDKCWVQVAVNKSIDTTDFSGGIVDLYKGFLACVMIRPLEGNTLYRSRPADVNYKGLQTI